MRKYGKLLVRYVETATRKAINTHITSSTIPLLSGIVTVRLHEIAGCSCIEVNCEIDF